MAVIEIEGAAAWSRSPGRQESQETVHGLFERQARSTPAAPAIVSAGRVWTYAELDRRADLLARELRLRDIGPEVRVALCAERSAELVAGLLAILKAGAAFVPMDPAYPRERLALLIEDSGAALILTQERLAADIPSGGRPLLFLEREAAANGFETPEADVLPEALAYLIYTSGSTGLPKAVAVTHANAVPLLAWSLGYFGLGPHTRVLQTLSPAFDFGVWEMLTTLLAGGTLHTAGRETAADPARWAAYAREHRVNTVHATPSFFREVAAISAAGSRLPEVEILHLGGEELTLGDVERMRGAVGPDCALYNGYGPTEATVNCLIHRVDGEEQGTSVPIGRPSAENAVYLLDAGGLIVEEGELCVGGPGVARGYLGRPELTAERFVPDPFPVEPGSRLYRTGDLASRLPDGEILFLGRIDQQVKVRGYRIELGEIEAALRAEQGVREAVVIVREETPGDRRLVAYVVPDGDLSPSGLRAALRERLPEPMVPSAFVSLPALPLTPHGKMDRRALPAPDPSALAVEARQAVAPRTPTEARIAAIWEEVLGLGGVGVSVEDDFFELGGHSLLAGRAASRIREAVGIEVSVRTLFDAPTPAALAAWIDKAKADGSATALETPIPRVSRDRDLPLSPAQERFWLLDHFSQGNPAYNAPVAFAVSGQIDAEVWRRSLEEVQRRHEALRTTFHPSPAGPVQRVEPAQPLPMPLADLSALPGKAARREAERLTDEDARRPFHLERGPVLRIALIRIGPEEHIALVHIHHIASDGWSLGVLLHDVQEIYSAFAAGRPSPLPELAVQVPDFAVWQREWLAGPGAAAIAGQLAYWRRRLAGDVPLELPSDRPRPAVRDYRGSAVAVDLGHRTGRPVRALARRHGATPYMVLMAVWQALLARLTGEALISVGTPVAGRTRREIEPLIGCFVNTVVLRTSLAGDPSFAETLVRVRELALEAQAHQDIPFDRVVADLQPDRTAAYSPLFQALFVLDDAPAEALALPGLSFRELRADRGGAVVDLMLSVHHGGENDEELGGWLEYASDLFDRPTAARLARSFATLLQGAVADPAAQLSELPLLTSIEVQQLLREWSGTGEPFPRISATHGLFEEQSRLDPNAAAVVLGDRELTYGELDARADRLARRLSAQGIGPERRVGLYLDRSLDLPVAVLGVLKTGGAYVALDPAYPAERVAYIAEDAAISILLTQTHLESRAPRVGALVLRMDDGEQDAWPPLAAPFRHPESLAYLTYTSGSTGRPKGIAMSHGGIGNLVAWQVAASRASGVPPGAATLQFASLAFDVSFQEMFSTWAAGGTVVMIPEELRFDPAALLRRIVEHGIGRLFLPPAFLQSLAQVSEGADDGPAALPVSLREVNAAGEQLQITPQIQALFHRLPETVLTNQYGPSETHLVTALNLAPDPDSWPALPSIGWTIAGARSYLLDTLDGSLRPVPAGVPGELYIGGAGLARGYNGRPDLTAERFIPDPFGGEPGARLYRSGDRIRFRANGEFEFLGRVDLQVKIRGFRIEPAEIEATLAAHPGVAECAVAVRRGPSGGPTLAAWFVAGQDPAPTARELREHLLRTLPDYMVPSIFVPLGALPLSPTGKVDRRALASAAPSREEAALREAEGDSYTPPRSVVEEIVTALWAEVLGVPRVGIHDAFFELGGHSLLAVQVLSRIRQDLGVELPVRALFEAPTPADLAQRIERALQEAAGTPAVPPVVPVVRDRAPRASFAQEQLWILDQVQPTIGVYNLSYGLRLSGPLDAGAWLRAVAEVRRRHESLRTTFRATSDAIVQVIAPPDGIAEPWPQVLADLSGLSCQARDAEVARLGLEEVMLPFDLATGPLFRSSLLRLEAEEHVVLFGFNHIISDGWSINVLLGELERLYPAFAAALPSPLPELPIQFADYAAWQRSWMTDEALAPHFAYWRRQLAGDLTLTLPADRPQPTVQSFRGDVEPLLLSPALSAEVMAFGRRSGGTLFMTLLATMAALLHRYTGSESVAVGAPVANRDRPELEGLIGLFANVLVLRTGLAGDPTFPELIARVRETVLGAFAHQDMPFEMLIKDLRPERTLDRIPLFQTVFTFQSIDVPDFGRRLRAADLPLGSQTSKTDLSLGLGETPDGVAGAWEYSTDIFDAATMARFSRHFERLLTGGITHPGLRLSELALLSPEETEQVLGWSTAAEVPLGASSLHARFAEQARRTPGAVAVSGEGVSLTYGELRERAGRLAGRLRELGAGAETLVGLCAERSPDLIAGILGILGAGAAYVPLDPAYPAERLAYILEDARAPLVVAQEHLLRRLPETEARIVPLEAAAAEGEVLEDPAVAGPDNAAYVIYTSGSTGKPKGVVVTHGNALRLFTATEPWFGFSSEDTWTLFHSFAFDFSVWEIWGALLYGGRVVVVPYWASRSPEAFLELLGRERVTVLNQTPSAFGLLAQAALQAESAPPALRQVIFGGEALAVRALSPWIERFGDSKPRLTNMYGITETTVHVTWRPVGIGDLSGATAPFGSPIGVPIPDLSVQVLDAHLRPLPMGVLGEMYVGGAGLARGYLGRPDLTAERFVPDPLAAQPGSRLYRTGDLARRHASGELEFLGRADAQVKIRGFRIEPGEVEAALASHLEISEGAVAARRGPAGETSLTATWCPAADPLPAGPGDARDPARTPPEHMVPSAFVTVESLPRTPSGKVDRRALARIQPERAARAAGRTLARTPAEEMLAGIFAEVLGIARPSLDEGFFDLGGHSLLATQVVNRARAAFSIDLPLRALFEAPTPAGLARRIEDIFQRQSGTQAAPRIGRRAGDTGLPLSFAQERLWFLDQVQPGAMYNAPFALRLTGPFDVAAWRPPSPRCCGATKRCAPPSPAICGGAAIPSRRSRRPPSGRCRRSISRACRRRNGRPRRAGWQTKRGGGRSTSRRARSPARSCCAWSPRSTTRSSVSITSSSTAGR